MSTLARPSASRTRPAWVTIIGIVGFAAAVAAASQIAIPLPFTPVPITLQPMLVILAGMWLGPAAGAASMLLYLGAGAAGLPVFTPIGAPGIARLFGPTGGFLLAYPAAAFIAGLLNRRAGSLTARWLAGIAGMIVLFLGGLTQLSVMYGSVGRAIELGLTPFAALDIVKALIAAMMSGSRSARRIA